MSKSMADTLQPEFISFLDSLERARALERTPDPDAPVIEVDEAVRSIAKFYEAARRALEYGELDLLTRRAIGRSLRRILSYGNPDDSEALALDMLRELIRGGYFPNETLPETIATPVAIAIERLFAALPSVSALYHDELVKFAVFEVEDTIFPERAAKRAATIEFVIETAETRLKWPQDVHSEAGHRAFLFVAAHKAVLKADATRILYALITETLPEWAEATPSNISDVSDEFELVLAAAKASIAHPRSEQYARSLRRFAPAFQAIEDTVESTQIDTESTLQLERHVEDAVSERIKSATGKLRRLAIRATLYVFLTKMVLALTVELPLNMYLWETFTVGPFIINLAFPPAMMALVALSARPPRQEVADRIIEDAMRIVADDKTLGHARLPRHRGFSRLFIFILSLTAFAGTGLVFLLRGLAGLDFTWVDTVIFLMFLSVISLFAWRVRQPLRELAAQRRTGILWMLVEVFMFPFLAVGRVLSDGLRSVNVFLWLLDVVIEAPLKFFFASFEDWIAFLREKREELID